MNQYPSEQQGIIISFLKVTSETKSKPFKKFQRFMTGPILEKNPYACNYGEKIPEEKPPQRKGFGF